MKFKKLLKFAIPVLGLAALAVSLPVALTSCGNTTNLNKKPSGQPSQTIPTSNQDITNTTKVLEGLAPDAKTGYLSATEIRQTLLDNLKVQSKDVAQMNLVITKADIQGAQATPQKASFWSNYAADAGSIPTGKPSTSGDKKPDTSTSGTGDTSKPDAGSKPEGKPSTEKPTKPQLKTLTTNISLTLNKNAAWPKDLSKDTSGSFTVNGQTLTLKDVKLTASDISVNANVISSNQIQQVIDKFGGLDQLSNLDINMFDNYLSAINPQFIPGSINSVSVTKNTQPVAPSDKPQDKPGKQPTSRAASGTDTSTAPTNTNVSLTVTLTPADNFVYLNASQQVEKTLVFNDISYNQQDLSLSLKDQQAMQSAIESVIGKTWTKDADQAAITAKQNDLLNTLNQLACLKTNPIQSVHISLNDVLTRDHPNQTANVTLTFNKTTNVELSNPRQDLFRYPGQNITNTLLLSLQWWPV